MKLRFLLISSIALLTIFGSVLPFKAMAVAPSSIAVNIAPENPAPGESTSITLNSYSSNLDSVLISWSVDGKNTLSGIGKKSFSLNAPNAGSETNIVATVYLPDGSIDKRIILRPAVMVLLWQANDSYTPPFYRGKALPAEGSEIKIVAMPEIKSGSGIVNPKNMVYAWKKDYTNNVDGSGYGKNAFTYINDYLENSNTLSVTASTTDQQYSSQKSIDVGTVQPKIVFYKNDPTLGTIWEHALSDGHRIIGDEVMQAAPYFISPGDIRIPTLIFNWFINDYQVAVANFTKNLMPLAVQAGTSGTSKIKLEIESTDKIFQSSGGEINVEF
jgi:hypothetical protein